MIHSQSFRSEIRRLSREQFAAEEAELAEAIASDSALATSTATKSSELTLEAAQAFMAQLEKKQAASKAEADRREAVDGLAAALKKARGL